MILSGVCRSGALAATALGHAAPSVTIPTKSAFKIDRVPRPTQMPSQLEPRATFALPAPHSLPATNHPAYSHRDGQPASFAVPPAPDSDNLGRLLTAVWQSGKWATSAPVATSTAAAAKPQQAETREAAPKRAPFRIPVPLDATQMRSIPLVREMLVRHATDTYNGVGKRGFDPTAQRTVADGSDTAVVPLSSNVRLHDGRSLNLAYATHRNRARYGLLLEQLDMFATWIGYKHNQDPAVPMDLPAHHTIGVVTALVDSIDVHQDQPPAPDKDIFYHGYTSWVGKSSSEVVVHVQQKHSEQDVREILTAKFIMVTLGPDGKAASNVKLSINTEEELERFNDAENSKRMRMSIQKNSLAKCLPTPEEMHTIHKLQMSVVDPASLTLQRHRAPENSAFMDQCAYDKSFICFPFQCNLHKKIFGGYLMRKAYEAAIINAQLFSGEVPQFVFGGEMVFHKPVEIGALLWMKSQVCYTKDNHMQINVVGQMLNKITNQLETCNSYQYTFKVERPLPNIVPLTYAENIRYLTAKRHFEIFVEGRESPRDNINSRYAE